MPGVAGTRPPKLLALLEVLLDAAPRAVTKSEIHKVLWPDTFVADATLTSLVAHLRTAIGDDGRTPRLLRTIHGYGYAFAADVVRAQPVPEVTDTRSFRIIMGDREIALARGMHLLGRSHDVAVFVDDPGVSRHHSRVTIDADGATLADLGSKNGTILERPTRHRCHRADRRRRHRAGCDGAQVPHPRHTVVDGYGLQDERLADVL